MIFFPVVIDQTRITPVVDTAIYASGDAISTTQEVIRATPNHGGQSKLGKIVVTDLSKQSAALKLLFFDQAPPAQPTDNAAYDADDAYLSGHCLGSVAIATTDYVALNDNSVATVIPIGGFPIKALNSKSIWVQIVSAGTPTYAAANELSIAFSFEKN